jgi:hypothetical protein
MRRKNGMRFLMCREIDEKDLLNSLYLNIEEISTLYISKVGRITFQLRCDTRGINSKTFCIESFIEENRAIATLMLLTTCISLQKEFELLLSPLEVREEGLTPP